MGTIDRLRQIKLTKKNCQKLLELNEGFVANTKITILIRELVKENTAFRKENYIFMRQ